MHAIKFTMLQLILSAALLTSSVGAQTRVERGKIFADHEKAALFKVKSVRFISEELSAFPGIQVRTYSAIVTIKDRLPNDTSPIEITITFRKGIGAEGEALGLQDWFPTVPGAEFVAVFNEAQLRDASTLLPISLGIAPEQAWLDCKKFFEVISTNSFDSTREFAQLIRSREADLGLVFFRLLFAHDRAAYQNRDFLLALSEYLESSEVDLNIRRQIIESYLEVPESAQIDIVEKLISGIIKTIADAYYSSEPKFTGPLARRLCIFIKRKSNIVRPTELSAIRANGELLLKLAADEQAIPEADIRQCLAKSVDAHADTPPIR